MKISNWEINRIEEKITPVEIILALIAVGGIVTLAILAGNAVQLLKKSKKNKIGSRYIETRLQNLIGKGYVKEEKIDGEKTLALTSKGKKELFAYKYRRQLAGNKIKWDGKWRIVIFDIREKRRKVRDYLRLELKELGFQHLQDSVWITPYDCAEYIELLKTDLQAGYSIIYLVVNEIDGVEQIKKSFNL